MIMPEPIVPFVFYLRNSKEVFSCKYLVLQGLLLTNNTVEFEESHTHYFPG